MKIGIFGTSGFAREVGDIAEVLGYEPAYIAAGPAELASWEFEKTVILESEIEKLGVTHFAIGIGENSIRERVAAKYQGRLIFPSLIHPSSSFGIGQREKIESQAGVIICAGARLTNNIDVGAFSIINLNATVGHDCIIEEFVNIAPGANVSGNVRIAKRAWIGTGATINQGDNFEKLLIGVDTTIGSGSVVIKSCDASAVYVGIPSKRIK